MQFVVIGSNIAWMFLNCFLFVGYCSGFSVYFMNILFALIPQFWGWISVLNRTLYMDLVSPPFLWINCVFPFCRLEATKSAILPELVELTNDEECHVRIAGLETVVNILTLLDAGIKNFVQKRRGELDQLVIKVTFPAKVIVLHCFLKT